MAFIRDDEFIIYMDLPTVDKVDLPIDDLKALRGAGIDTAIIMLLDWQQWNDDYIDRVLSRFQRVGMKVLLPLWYWHNKKLNPAWYTKYQGGTRTILDGRGEYLLSPFHDKAQDYYNYVMSRIKDKYTSDACQVISFNCRCGETVMPKNTRYYNDDEAMKKWNALGHKGRVPDERDEAAAEFIRDRYIEVLSEQQRILVDSPWREIWFSLHRGKENIRNSSGGCNWIDDYIEAWLKLQPAQINHITFSSFPVDGVTEKVVKEQARWPILEWVGAEYCEGLRKGNAQKAINLGFRGMVLSPCHPDSNPIHKRIEKWMLVEIEKAVGLWVAGRH